MLKESLKVSHINSKSRLRKLKSSDDNSLEPSLSTPSVSFFNNPRTHKKMLTLKDSFTKKNGIEIDLAKFTLPSQTGEMKSE